MWLVFWISVFIGMKFSTYHLLMIFDAGGIESCLGNIHER